jgi:hypothetical protein
MPTCFRLITIVIAACAACATIAWRSDREVTIVAREIGFDAPDSVSAGLTTIHVENRGPNLRHVAIVRLDSGHTTEEFQAAVAREDAWPSWITFLGGPQVPVGGARTTVTINLAPGRYLITCIVHAPDSASHTMVSHVVSGMVRPLTVTGVDQPAAVPRADVTITLIDYNFYLSRPLDAGTHLIRVRNAGPQPHVIVLVQLLPGKSMADLATWAAQRNGPSPAHLIGGLTPISGGSRRSSPSISRRASMG